MHLSLNARIYLIKLLVRAVLHTDGEIKLSKRSLKYRMDQDWDNVHAPSACAKHPRWNAKSDKPLAVTARRLQKNTRALKEIPYEPGLWLLRAQLLLGLGYPELAAGDAYKARLLVEASYKATSALGAHVRLQYGMCLWLGWHHRWDPALGGLDSQFVDQSNIHEEVFTGLQGYEQQAWSILIIALQHADCLLENQELAREAERKFGASPPHDTGPWSQDYQDSLRHLIAAKHKACEAYPELSHDPFLVRKAMLNGTIVIRQYPWMASFLERSEATIEAIKADITDVSASRCVAQKSNIRAAKFGVFATQAIAKGENFLTDRSYTTGTSVSGRCSTFQCRFLAEPILCETCQEQFCSVECLQIARSKFHDSACCKVSHFQELEEAGLVKHSARNPLADILLLQRFLALVAQSLQNGVRHPLEVPEIARLIANYTGSTPTPWNFMQDIVFPVRVLQNLNVDVFADYRFDTWVIQTIIFRIINNSAMGYLDGHKGREAPMVKGVYLRHALFNHSCDPNVSYDDHASLAAQVMRAKRDIEAGEELYIAYDLGLDAEGMDVWRRREALRNWMGEDCNCARCLKEIEEMGDLVDPFKE